MCNEKRTVLRRVVTTATVALVLFVVNGTASDRTGIFRSMDKVLVISRPETTPARRMERKRFRPAAPKLRSVPSLPREIRLYSGNKHAPAPAFVAEPLPSIDVKTDIEPDSRIFIPEVESPVVRRYPRRVSLRKDLVDFRDLDYGRYMALTSKSENDKQSIRGFVHIPAVWGQQLTVPDQLKRAVLHLVEGINRYTDLDAAVDAHLFLSSPSVLKAPFLYITAEQAFELTPLERENLGRYLKNGGFVFADNGTPQYDMSAAEASLKQMFRDALGCHARFEPIPESHPVYHCFFDFDDGPPQGSEIDWQSTETGHMVGRSAYAQTFHRPAFFLEGVYLDNRLAAVYSNKGYAQKWKDLTNNVPQLKFGVNFVVYALTREGGITQRNMMRFADIQ